MPEEYANTIANKANCLSNLPDDPENPEAGNPRNIMTAVGLLREAQAIFRARGATEKADAVGEAVAELTAALAPHSAFQSSTEH